MGKKLFRIYGRGDGMDYGVWNGKTEMDALQTMFDDGFIDTNPNLKDWVIEEYPNEQLINEIKNWDCADAEELLDNIKKLKNLMIEGDKIENYINLGNLPTIPFPENFDTLGIWARDKKNQIIVGEMDWEVINGTEREGLINIE